MWGSSVGIVAKVDVGKHKKLRCSLTEHEMPRRLDALKQVGRTPGAARQRRPHQRATQYIAGRKYKLAVERKGDPA
jgi:hypothetical protein